MFGKKKKKYYTPEQLANRKRGAIRTESDSAKEHQRKSADRARTKQFFEGFNN